MDVISTVWAWRNPPDPARIEAARTRARRRHGLGRSAVGAGLGMLIFSLPWWWPGAAEWLPRAVAFVAWGVSGVLLLAAVFSPNRVYATIDRGVNLAAHGVGMGLTVLLMTPIFALFFVPFRALLRRGRRDRLRRAFPAPEARSFWIERADPPRPETYRRQF